MHFPSWRYHRELEPKLVQNELESESLGDDWKDSPAHFENPGSYKEHMEKWESKEEIQDKPKKKRGKA